MTGRDRTAPTRASAPGRSDRAPARSAFDAVVLAGGQGTRSGVADKPGLLVGGRPMVESVIRAAVAAGAGRVIVAGPPRADLLTGPHPPAGLAFVREDPPGSGPVAALRCGLARVTAPMVAVLAADLPFLRDRHLRQLLAAAGPDGDRAGAVLLDESRRPQWLAGCWRSGELAAAVAAYHGSSLRGLLGPLDPAAVPYRPVPGEPPPWFDCDTPADLEAARRWQDRRNAG